LGFHITKSVVRPIAATRTSFVTSSPSLVLRLTVVTYSRGSDESIVNGMRTVLPFTPNVGASRLSSSTSGRRVGLPAVTVKRGTPFTRILAAAWTGGGPSFQSPSEAMTTPMRFGMVSSALVRGAFRSLPCPA